MITTEVSESIYVGAVFKQTKIIPKWFIWDGRKYAVDQITYTWHDFKGQEPRYYLQVTTSGMNCELCFNQKTLQWKLVRTHVEG